MKVLFINPPWNRFFGGSSNRPPLSLVHVAAYLKETLPDIDVDLLDADFDDRALGNILWPLSFVKGHSKYIRKLKDNDDEIWSNIESAVKKFAPDVVGVSVMTATYAASLRVAEIVKMVSPKTKVVFGGRHPTAIPELVLRNDTVDFVVGEGEQTMVELLDNLHSPQNVSGLAYREGGKIIDSVPRGYIRELDTLPFPIFQSRITTYPFEPTHSPNHVWTMIGARGCPFKCTYCAAEPKSTRSPGRAHRRGGRIRQEDIWNPIL